MRKTLPGDATYIPVLSALITSFSLLLPTSYAEGSARVARIGLGFFFAGARWTERAAQPVWIVASYQCALDCVLNINRAEKCSEWNEFVAAWSLSSEMMVISGERKAMLLGCVIQPRSR